jgi:uncharacterized membrane protein
MTTTVAGHTNGVCPNERHVKTPKRDIAVWFLVGMLTCHAGLLAWSAWKHSPTYPEPAHLAAGVSHWSLGAYGLFSVNPPLVREVAALPVVALDPKTDWARIADPPSTRPEDEVGVEFLVSNGPESLRWTAFARWACIPFSLLGAWTCFAWARRLFGTIAGLTAATMWCFSPYILGHAAIIVPDAHAAALGTAAFYAYWLWLRQPDWSRSVIAGILLGLAELSKFTLLVFYPLLLILWLIVRQVPCRDGRSRRWLTETGMLLALMTLSVAVINVGYSFEGSFRQLGQLRFQTMVLTGAATRDNIPAEGANRFDNSWLQHFPVPLPGNYVQGIDLQASDFEKGLRSYLRGRWSDRGWWYYYVYALAIKMPLGTWALLAIAVAATVFGRRDGVTWKDELVVLVPPTAIVLAASSQSGFSIHSRYVIPALPFLFIWTSKVARIVEPGTRTGKRRVLAVTVVLALTWSITSSLWIYPHSISYFNELVSGPKGGPRHLLNSNIDWAQDLLYFKEWLDGHQDVQLNGIDHFGNGSSTLMGLPTAPLPPFDAPRDLPKSLGTPPLPVGEAMFGPKPGWYALSVNRIYGQRRSYRYFLNFSPAARVGYSIHVYHITLEDANRLRRQLGLPELRRDERHL